MRISRSVPEPSIGSQIARDHTLIEQLRDKGAIICAKSVPDEYNARAGDPGGSNEATTAIPATTGYQRVRRHIT